MGRNNSYRCSYCQADHDRGDVAFAHRRWPEAFIGLDETAVSVPIFAGFDRFLRERFPRHASARDLIRALLFMAPFEGGIADSIQVSDRALTKHAGIPAGSLVEARAAKGFADLCPFEVGQQWVAGTVAAITRYDLGTVLHAYGHWARENGFVKTRRTENVEQRHEPAPAAELDRLFAPPPRPEPVEAPAPLPSCATCALYGVDWVLGKPRPCYMHGNPAPADLDYLGIVARQNTVDEERARAAASRRAA